MNGRAGRATWARVGAVALLVGHGVLAWVGRGPGILTRQDDALYIILARSLLGGSYRDLYRVGTPLHSLYPPGYPAELALWGGVFGFRFDAIVLFSVLCSVLALFLIWKVADRFLGPWLALAVLAPIAVNPMLLEAAGNVASEAPYLMLTVVALWLSTRKTGPDRPGRGRFVLIGSIALLASITRAAGVALLGGLLLEWLFERRWVSVVVFGSLSVVVFAGWLSFSGRVSREVGAKSYVTTMVTTADGSPAEAKPKAVGPVAVAAAWTRRIYSNARYYATNGAPWALAVPTIPGTVVDNLLSTLILLGAGITGVAVMVGWWRTASLYILVYVGVLLLYAWQQPRFFMPIVPFVIVACIAGMSWWAARWRWKPLRVLLPGLISVALFGSGCVRSGAAVNRLARCDRSGDLPDPTCMRLDQRSWFQAIRYIREHIPAGTVLLSAKPEPLFVYTGLRTVGMFDIDEPPDSEFIGRIRGRGAQYILLGSLQAREPNGLSRRMLANCDSLTLEAYFPARTYLFRVAAPTSDAGRRASCDAMVRYRAANLDRIFGPDP